MRKVRINERNTAFLIPYNEKASQSSSPEYGVMAIGKPGELSDAEYANGKVRMD